MKKMILALFAAFSLVFSGGAMAETNFGVSAQIVSLEASGTETEGGETNSKDISHVFPVGSIFAERTGERFTVGLDWIPFDADVSSKTHKRTDTETSVTGTAAATSTSRTQTAQAQIQNHLTLYGEMMLGDTYYAKAGYIHVTVDAQESLGTGSKYGSADINGVLIGAGVRTGNLKYEVTYTDYDDVSLTSSVARTGVSTNNKVTADLDATAFKISYVF